MIKIKIITDRTNVSDPLRYHTSESSSNVLYIYFLSLLLLFQLSLHLRTLFLLSFYLLDLHLRIRITEVSHFADPDPKHWLKFNYHSARSL